MIFGVGTDIVTIARIADAWDRWGDRFAARILTAHERASLADAREPLLRGGGERHQPRPNSRVGTHPVSSSWT